MFYDPSQQINELIDSVSKSKDLIRLRPIATANWDLNGKNMKQMLDKLCKGKHDICMCVNNNDNDSMINHVSTHLTGR